MKTTFKDVAQLYIGCQMNNNTTLYSFDAESEFMLLDNEHKGCSNFRPEWNERIKLILKPTYLLTPKEFTEICSVILETENVISDAINGLWVAAEYVWVKEEEEGMNISDRILLLEEADHENVFSIPIPKKQNAQLSLGHGTSEEMRYFAGIDIQSIFMLELCKRGYDIFGLIEKGQAVSVEETEKI